LHHYWSFDLAQPIPGQHLPPDPAPYFCEVIFHLALQLGTGSPPSLGINDIVAIAMGASASSWGTGPYEEGLPQLDIAMSQALGPTTVTLNNGIATLTALNLRVDLALAGAPNLFVQATQTSSPPVTVQFQSTLGGGPLSGVQGTFQPKSSWVSGFHILGTPPPGPEIFVQPSQGEFSQ
jgi:hypothetical protein